MPHPHSVTPTHVHLKSFNWELFRALRSRDFRLMWSANLFSNLGTSTYVLALSWIAVKEYGAEGLAIVTLAYGICQFLFELWGGLVSDRFNRRMIFFTTEFLMTIVAFILAFCASVNFLPLWFLGLINGINGSISAFDSPARTTLINDLVPAKDLVDAQELYGIASNITSILGPALGGVLLAVGDRAIVFWVNAISFLPVLISILLIRVQQQHSTPPKDSILKRIKQGLSYIQKNQALKSLMFLMTLVMVLGLPYQTLLPIYAHKVLHMGSSEFAALSSASGFGAFIGAFLAAEWSHRQKSGRLMFYSSLCFAFFLFLFSQSPTIHLASLSIFLAGVCSTIALNLDAGLIQFHTPSELRGRVTSISYLNKGILSASASGASYLSSFIGMVNIQLGLIVLLCLGLLWIRPRIVN